MPVAGLEEGLAGGVGRPAVGGADAERAIGRVGVGLGGVGPHRGDPHRLQGRGEVGVGSQGSSLAFSSHRGVGSHSGVPTLAQYFGTFAFREGTPLSVKMSWVSPATGHVGRRNLRSCPPSCCRAGWPSSAWRSCRSRPFVAAGGSGRRCSWRRGRSPAIPATPTGRS